METLKVENDTNESKNGTIKSRKNNMIVTETLNDLKMYEMVFIKSNDFQSIGEVTQMYNNNKYIFCIDDPSPISIKDSMIIKTGKAISIQFGPGIFESGCFSSNISIHFKNSMKEKIVFTNKNKRKNFNFDLDGEKKWLFIPNKFSIDDYLVGGQIIGKVDENGFEHRIMLPPKAKGNLIYQAQEGEYNINYPIVKLETSTGITEYTMSHLWPIRQPRQISKENCQNFVPTPIITGIPLLDLFFPTGFGSKIAMCNHLSNSAGLIDVLLNNSNTDFTILVDLELNNEDTLFSKEISIFSAIRIAEYIRDMGYNVNLIINPITIWVESLKFKSDLIAEEINDQNFENINSIGIGNKFSDIFNTAGIFKCLGDEEKFGTLTILGIFPLQNYPLKNPVIISLMISIDVFWKIDMNWIESYTKNSQNFNDFFNYLDSDFIYYRNTMLKIFYDNDENNTEVQKMYLDVGATITNSFSFENEFEKDNNWSILKTICLVKCYSSYIKNSEMVLKKFPEIFWEDLKNKTFDLINELKNIKCENELDYTKLYKEKFEKIEKYYSNYEN